MTAPGTPSDLPPVSQPVVQDLTRAAIFLVVTINPGTASRAAVRSFCSDLPALVRAVGFRDIEGNLSCELAVQIMARLGEAVSPLDEVHGFRYFDDRDLIGFVDGTENPTGQAAIDAAYVGAEDAVFAGGSYVIVQKYLHDLAGWNALSTEAQERIIGRTKLSDIELEDAVKPAYAHNALAKVVVDGKEIKIIRDNMPFGRAAEKEFGTYFIGYARSPRTIEQMLENMFVGQPPGNYDRLLDFSVAKTGNLFFVPSATFLENIADGDPAAGVLDTPAVPAPTPALRREGSLDIGSLKGDPAS